MHGGGPRERAVQGVGLGQQGHIGGGELAGKAVHRGAIALDQGNAVAGTANQAGELLTRVARGVLQVAQHHALVVAPQCAVGKAPEHRADERVALSVVGQRAELHLQGTLHKSAQLRHRAEAGFVHVDHHGHDDRPKS